MCRLEVLYELRMASIGVIKLVLIGDVHGYWDPDLDPAALRFLQPDAAIFVGKNLILANGIVQ